MVNRGPLLPRNPASNGGVGFVPIYLGSMLVRDMVRGTVEEGPSQEVMFEFGLKD